MQQHSIPETEDDRRSLRDLLHLAVGVVRTQAAVARELGVDRTTVGKYLSGDRASGLGWHVVVAALRGAVREHPEAASRVVQEIAERWLDLRGTWVPHHEHSGSWERESSEAIVAQGELHRAVLEGCPDQIESSARAAIRETHEAAVVAIGVAAARRRGKVA